MLHIEAADTALQRVEVLSLQIWRQRTRAPSRIPTAERLPGKVVVREIERAASPGARIIFRTAGEETILPGRIPDEILSRFDYDEARCKAWTARDRSSIYGGFHLYTLRKAAASA